MQQVLAVGFRTDGIDQSGHCALIEGEMGTKGMEELQSDAPTEGMEGF